jgi:capsular polysaccharide biosynthesis protein
MEYVELLLILKKHYQKLIISSFIGLVISLLLFYFLPATFISEGTLYIYPINNFSQKQEVTSDLNFARNIIGISESPEFREYYSGKIKQEVSYVPLIGLTMGLKLKEITPNLVSLSIKDASYEKAKNKFEVYKSSLIEFSNKLKKGNATFDIETLNPEPVSYQISNNLYLFLSVGFLIGFSFGFIYLFLGGKKK